MNMYMKLELTRFALITTDESPGSAGFRSQRSGDIQQRLIDRHPAIG